MTVSRPERNPVWGFAFANIGNMLPRDASPHTSGQKNAPAALARSGARIGEDGTDQTQPTSLPAFLASPLARHHQMPLMPADQIIAGYYLRPSHL